MQFNIKNPEKVVRRATLFTLLFMVAWGIISVIFQIRPFWIDEWRVIYNLKFKTSAELWGPLDFMQQFPRVYLQLVKGFTSWFNYNYFSLRLPSFIVGSLTMLMAWRVMKRIFPEGHFNRFLFVIILISSCTFTDYFVQIKQYTMDLLLSLIALWQFIELIELPKAAKINWFSYLILSLSFAVVPYFSYIYPIAISPVFIIVFIQALLRFKDNKASMAFKQGLNQGFPLLLCLISILLFYKIDVAQLMADKGMHQYWGHLMMKDGFNLGSFLNNFFNFFAEEGAGLIYWLLFGILGMGSFIFGIYYTIKYALKNVQGFNEQIRLYCVMLLIVVTILFLAGKFPMGEPRLNSFTVPSMAILMILLLDSLAEVGKLRKVSVILSVILYVGVIGNIYTTFFSSISGPEYNKKLSIYRATEKAISEAQSKHLPIYITPEVAYPYDKTLNLPYNTTVPGDWVLKTFPAFDAKTNTPVINIKSVSEITNPTSQVSTTGKEIMIGDGLVYSVLKL